MLKALLVDDNRYALAHFSGLADWEDCGYTLIGTASDGIEGLQVFRREHPDLVITDIQMPGMDGRELAGKIRREAPRTVVIFLSSYDEFDYVRAAVDLDVYEYILKQELTKEALERKLRQIREKIQRSTAQDDARIKGALLTCFRLSPDEVDEDFFADQRFLAEKSGLFFMEQDHVPEQIAEVSHYQVPEADYRYMEKRLRQALPGLQYLVRYERFRWVGVTGAGVSCEDTVEEMRKLLADGEESFSIMICPEVSTVLDCRRLFDRYCFLPQLRYFEGPSSLIYAQMCEAPIPVPAEKLQDAMMELDEMLIQRPEDIARSIDRTFLPILCQCDYPGFIRMVCHIIHKLDVRIREHQLSLKLYDEEVAYLISARRIIRWLKEKTSLVLELANPRYTETTDAALTYMQNHFSDSLLSVEEVARESGISVNRLNELMKKELGKTAGKYLTQLRMEKAREYLSRGIPVLEVAARTGYSTPSYFSHAFHKACGLSPQEYQRRLKK